MYSLATVTYDLELGINIPAVSLPFSTLMILGVLSAGEYFTSSVNVLAFGFLLILLPLISKVVLCLRMRTLDLEIDLQKN